VTARKGIVPKGAAWSAEENLWFEKKALAELERLPTHAWEDMDALWRMVPSAWPSTRQRILAHCLELAAKRGEGLSAELVKRFAEPAIRELAVSTAPKASVHDEDGLRKVARHLARNPLASLSELAAAAGSDEGFGLWAGAADGKKTTVRQWMARPDFQALLNDERHLVALEQARRAWRLEHDGPEGLKDLGAAAADWLDQRDRTRPRRKVKRSP
jgi:hypothetical protein